MRARLSVKCCSNSKIRCGWAQGHDVRLHTTALQIKAPLAGSATGTVLARTLIITGTGAAHTSSYEFVESHGALRWTSNDSVIVDVQIVSCVGRAQSPTVYSMRITTACVTIHRRS